MKLLSAAAGAAALVLAGSPCAGQSVNVDFGDEAGVPPAAFAAAGLAGVWNGIDEPPGVAVPLAGLGGAPVAATVSYAPGQGLPFTVDDPATTGDDERLMDDGIGGLGDVVTAVTFTGLINGTYEVITCAWTPTIPADTTLVMIDDDFSDGLIAGGAWPGGYVAGVTHVVHEVEIVDHALTVSVVGGYFGASGFLNGIQLRRLTAADVNGDGMVGGPDLVEVILRWGATAAAAGPADVDGSGIVDGNDLIAVILGWG